MSNIISGSYTGEESTHTFGVRMVVLSSVILCIAIGLLVYSQSGTQESSEATDLFGERREASRALETEDNALTPRANRSRVGAFGNSGFSDSVNNAVTSSSQGSGSSTQNPELSREISGCAGAENPVRCQAIQVTKEFLLADLHKHSIEFVEIHYMRQGDGTPFVCGHFRVLNSGLATARPFVSSKLSGYPVIGGVSFDQKATLADTPLLSATESTLADHPCFKH